MAKQLTKKSDLPTVDEMPTAETTAGQTATVAVAELTVTKRLIEVPLAQISFGYLPRRVDLRKLSGRQSQVLRQLEEALAAGGARLADGSRINSSMNAIKWLLETIAGE